MSIKNFKKKLILLSISFLLFLPQFTLKAQLISGGNLNDTSREFAASASFTDIGIGSIIATIISIVLSLLALIFLVLTIMAGFKWMNAGGNEEEVKKAQTTLKNAIIGLVIVLAAYAITYFIFNSLPFSGGGRLNDGVAV
ncbi:hypothetical protein JXK06_02080 [Patescibacteria group bacterium]|nr:hypothetical protein [Patescibacteria group bacterium]